MKKPLVLSIVLHLFLFLATLPALGQTTYSYVVNDAGGEPDANPGDKVCATAAGKCTLYAAIQEANLDGANSHISFAQPVEVKDELPAITESYTTIDASSQWDSSGTLGGMPGVTIWAVNTNTYMDPALIIEGNYTTIKGIQFVYYDYGTGIWLTGDDCSIGGGSYDSERNVFLTLVGVVVSGDRNDIGGNYFGTPDGYYSFGSELNYGVHIFGSDNLIHDNVIGGYTEWAGVICEGNGNIIQGNIIGLGRSLTNALPNLQGIEIYGGFDNEIRENRISGNLEHGIYCRSGSQNTIISNDISPKYSHLPDCRNGGDGIRAGREDWISGNLIKNNLGNGISTWNDKLNIINNNIQENECIGIYIGGSKAVIYGNSISSNNENGVTIDSGNSNTVSHNGIIGNQGHGILMDNGASENTIGGSSITLGNVIHSNMLDGIRLTGAGTTNNTILSNILGIQPYDPYDWLYPEYDSLEPNEHHGIALYNGADGNTIGQMGEGNTIVGSGWSGLAIVNSDSNVVVANRIGTEWGGHRWGNLFYGVHVVGGSQNFFGLNEIAYNGAHSAEAGICVDGSGAVLNDMFRNSIHDNHGEGIALVNGANNNMPAPEIQSIKPGILQGAAYPGCIVEIYSDFEDEGRLYEGSVTATGMKGSFVYEGRLKGPKVTALARLSGDTSRFSQPVCVPRSLPYLMLLLQ